MGFLSFVLSRDHSPVVVQDMLKGLRPSSSRQYESCWKKFQAYVASQHSTSLSSSLVLDFLSFLFHQKGLSPASISVHWAALSDPLKFGFNISVDARSLELLRRGFFLRRPPVRRQANSWSLQAVLDSLPATAPSAEQAFEKALFLLAMASGLRSSQLHALTRHPGLTVFTEDGSSVSLAPSPAFLAKNEREGHVLDPLIIPAWREDGVSHPLCPVAALREYLRWTRDVGLDRLFVWPSSLRLCSRPQLARVLKRVISSADPRSSPLARDTRGVSASMAFLRLHSVDAVRVSGQWSSSHSFATRYWSSSVVDVPCVAMGTLPRAHSN